MTDKFEDWQQRVVEEATELKKKCEALIVFLDTDAYESLALVEKAKLTTQVYFMKEYYEVLLDRIAGFLGEDK